MDTGPQQYSGDSQAASSLSRKNPLFSLDRKLGVLGEVLGALDSALPHENNYRCVSLNDGDTF